MATKSRTTIDQDEIRRWAEERGGKPATVKGTAKGGKAGILRIDFPGYSGEESLQQISWDEFFKKFEESNLAFIHQDKTATGRISRFGKFVDRGKITAMKSGQGKRQERAKKAA